MDEPSASAAEAAEETASFFTLSSFVSTISGGVSPSVPPFLFPRGEEINVVVSKVVLVALLSFWSNLELHSAAAAGVGTGPSSCICSIS